MWTEKAIDLLGKIFMSFFGQKFGAPSNHYELLYPWGCHLFTMPKYLFFTDLLLLLMGSGESESATRGGVLEDVLGLEDRF